MQGILGQLAALPALIVLTVFTDLGQLDEVDDVLLDRLGDDVVSFVIGVLDVAATLGFIHGPGH